MRPPLVVTSSQMLCEQNFRPLTNLLESGYAVQVEVGDLVEEGSNKTVASIWHDQAMRVTVTSPSGDVECKVFRGSKRRIQANTWIRDVTSDAIISV